MSKKQAFIDFVQSLITSSDLEMNEDARIYWNALRQADETEKPPFTDNGKLVLKYIKDNSNITTWKAKDVAIALGISSRTVSGASRKLVTDGYLEKLGQDPVLYALTEKGKEIILD